MPMIRPSSDLRNNYNEISTLCHETNKPIYITKNGAGDLAVMSIELYEALTEGIDLPTASEKSLEENKQPQKEKKVENVGAISNRPCSEETAQIALGNFAEQNLMDSNRPDSETGAHKEIEVKPEIETKPTENQEVESALELLQEIEIEPVVKPAKKEKVQSETTVFKKIDTDIGLTQEKENTNKINNDIQKSNSTNSVFRKLDTDFKPIENLEVESALELLQEIEIVPAIKNVEAISNRPNKESDVHKEIEKLNSTDTVFRELDTSIKPIEKKEIQNAKDINNTDWIFEDLDKMLNDIKL